jgi:hypothetical protein
MISLLGQIANLVGFSLEEAHKTELKIAELWLDTQLVRGRYYKNLISKVKFWLARSSAHSSSK